MELVFSDGMCFSSSKKDGGTRFKAIGLKSKDRWEVVDVKTDMTEKAIRTFCMQENGKPYGLRDVSRFLLPVFRNKRGRWFCSEICAAALGLKSKDVTPGELYEMVKACR